METIASVRFGPEDRDDRGFVKVRPDEPRKLADLLPPPPAGTAAGDGSSAPAPAGNAPPAAPPDHGDGSVTPSPAPRPAPSREQLLTAGGIAGGLLAAALLIWLIGWTAPPAPGLPASAAPSTGVQLNAPTAAPSPAPAPTAAAARAIVGRFDYHDPNAATALLSTQISRVVGQAGDWRLVATTGGGQVWIAASDVPAGTPADSPLADLAPPTPRPAPPAPVNAPAAPAAAPAPSAPAPVSCDPATAPYRVTQQVLRNGSPIGSVEGVSCASQDEAAARADKLAAKMRASTP